MTLFDTIAAPITGSGMGAVAIVRVSGQEAWRVGSEVFEPWRPVPLRATYGRYRNGDDGLALPFAEGHSYTGEEAVEFSVHGSQASVRSLMEACLRAGARMAEPGEFTQRAFLNGRMDLTQAEAVRDTIEARTEAQLRLANLQREGSLRRRILGIREIVSRMLAAIEASVDFSEEIGELDREAAAASLCDAVAQVDALIETAGFSRILRQGLRVAIVGAPNVGKSSLLNTILGIERAIVTEIPGTTRDFVEEQIEVEGFPIVLIDTAGLREAQDRIESIGIQRTRAIAAEADHVWYVYDASIGWTSEDEEFVSRDRGIYSAPELNQLRSPKAAPSPGVTIVANKADLAKPTKGIAVSALTGAGLGELLQSLPVEKDIGHREIAINSRHSALLMETRDSLETAEKTLQSQRPTDLASVLLQDAMYALGQVTGETASADMLTRIFSDFCIGK